MIIHYLALIALLGAFYISALDFIIRLPRGGGDHQ